MVGFVFQVRLQLEVQGPQVEILVQGEVQIQVARQGNQERKSQIRVQVLCLQSAYPDFGLKKRVLLSHKSCKYRAKQSRCLTMCQCEQRWRIPKWFQLGTLTN